MSWGPPANVGAAGTQPILRYEIRHSSATLDDDDDWTIVAGEANGFSHVITDLTNTTTYNIEVRAVSAAGNGAAASTTGTPAG